MDQAQRKGRCSQTMKLTIAAAVLLLIIAILFVTMVVIRSKQVSKSTDSGSNHRTGYIVPNGSVNLCLTPSCITTAAIFLESMDESADPCADFYNFACGRYVVNATMPENRVSRQRIDLIEDSLNLAMRSLLEKPKMGSEMSFVQKAKSFYAACMNSTQINGLRSKPLLDLLARLDGWPVVTDPSGQIEIDYILSKNQPMLNKLGLKNDQIFTLKVLIDKSRKPDFLIIISEPALAIPYVNATEEVALKHPDIIRYQELITAVAEKLGAITKQESVTKQIEDIVRFEYRLSQIITKSKKNKLGEVPVITLKQLMEEVPQFKWSRWLSGLVFKNLTESDPVHVGMEMDTKHVQKIADAIDKVNTRVLKNYVLWRVIFSTLHLLSSEYQYVMYHYESMKAGHETVIMPERWEVCVRVVNERFKHALGNMYFKYFMENNRDEQLIEQFFQELKEQMNKLISDADWLDYKTRTTAIGKIQEMKSLIGYPKEILDEDSLQRLYKDIRIVPNEYFRSTLRLEHYFSKSNITKLRLMDKLKWYNELATKPIASYSLQKNQIEIPAGMMHKFYLAADRPNYINYAIVGYQIAHQIAHGFGSTDPLYDKDGNLAKWWNPSAASKFEERASCLVDKYSTYIAPESNIQVDGVKTSAGNIADYVGVKIAYAAYRARMTKNNKQEGHLPYFAYSTEQLFWISYANNWCAKLSPSASKQNMESDLHSPPRFRVNGVVSNSPDFARDFKCKERTKMNPMEKCKVW